MNVNPGQLNKKINIYSPAVTLDADGYPTGSATLLYSNVPAKFSRTSGTELIKSNADFADIKVRFLIRYKSGIDRKMTISYAGDSYEIVYINDYEDRHEYIELFCRVITNG